MLTRQQIQGNIEHGKDPHGSPHFLQAPEFSNGIKIALEGNDDLVELDWRQGAIEVARQQHR